MDVIQLGNRIKEARQMRSMTLDDIANDIGVAKSTIQRYETGKINVPKIPVVLAIANSLRVNPSWLIGKDVPMIVIDESTPTAAPQLRPDEKQLLSHYNSLNSEGKERLMEQAEMLSGTSKYTKDTESQTG